MEITLQFLGLFSVTVLVLALPVYGQPGPGGPGLPCTPAMVNSLSPCMNFLNNVTANVSTPTPDCCNSLKSLTTNSSGCFCSLVSGNVPFPIAFNRTLAISLPQACNMPGVPVQCKASTTAPVPSPGPVPTSPQSPSPAASPTAPTPPVADTPPPAAETPDSSTTPTTSTTPTVGSGGTNTSAPSPSSAISSTIASPFVAVVGIVMLAMISA